MSQKMKDDEGKVIKKVVQMSGVWQLYFFILWRIYVYFFKLILPEKENFPKDERWWII